MAGKILIRRGNFADLPDLDQGELGYVEDHGTVYIGTDTDYNILLNPIQVNADGYSLDGYLYPTIDNVHGLGTSNNRWANLNLGPGSLHILSKDTDPGYSSNNEYKIGIDPTSGKLQIIGNNNVLLEADPNSGISIDGLVSETIFQEHANQQNQINQTILQSLDGYQAQINTTVSETTFQQHENQQNQINQTILQSLDGYATTDLATDSTPGLMSATDKQSFDWLGITSYTANTLTFNPIAPGDTYLFNNTIVRAYQFNCNNGVLFGGTLGDNQLEISAFSPATGYLAIDVSVDRKTTFRNVDGDPTAATIGRLTTPGFQSSASHGILDTGQDGVEIYVFNSPRWIFRDIAGGFYSIHNASSLAFDRTGAQTPTTQINETADGVLAIQHVGTGTPPGALSLSEIIGLDSSNNQVSTIQPYAWSVNPAAFQGIRIDGTLSGFGVALFAVSPGVLYAWDPVSGSSGGFRSDNFSNGAGSFSVDISGNAKVSTLKFGGTASIAISESPANVAQITLADLSTLIPVRMQGAALLGSTPSSSGDTGIEGEIRVDDSFIYRYASGAWKRATLTFSTF